MDRTEHRAHDGHPLHEQRPLKPHPPKKPDPQRTRRRAQRLCQHLPRKGENRAPNQQMVPKGRRGHNSRAWEAAGRDRCPAASHRRQHRVDRVKAGLCAGEDQEHWTGDGRWAEQRDEAVPSGQHQLDRQGEDMHEGLLWDHLQGADGEEPAGGDSYGSGCKAIGVHERAEGVEGFKETAWAELQQGTGEELTGVWAVEGVVDRRKKSRDFIAWVDEVWEEEGEGSSQDDDLWRL